MRGICICIPSLPEVEAGGWGGPGVFCFFIFLAKAEIGMAEIYYDLISTRSFTCIWVCAAYIWARMGGWRST